MQGHRLIRNPQRWFSFHLLIIVMMLTASITSQTQAAVPNNLEPIYEQQLLRANPIHNYHYFGNSIAVDGDTLVVGTRGGDFRSTSQYGGAYVFTRNSALGSAAFLSNII